MSESLNDALRFDVIRVNCKVRTASNIYAGERNGSVALRCRVRVGSLSSDHEVNMHEPS